MSNSEKNPLAEMSSHELLDRIIPRGAAKTVAYHTHRSADLVRKWQRDPDSEDGASSPLDEVDHLMQALMIVNPLAVPNIPAWVNNRYAELIRARHASPFDSSEQRRDAASEFLQHAIDTFKALNAEGATDHTLELFMQLYAVMDQNVERVRASLAKRNAMTGSLPIAQSSS